MAGEIMKPFFPLLSIILLVVCGTLACRKERPMVAEKKSALTETELREKAKRLAQQFIIVDTHIDVPYRLMKKMEDISVRTEEGNFDYPRAKEGGLNVPFMSIYVPAEYEGKGAKAYADKLIDMVEGFARNWPEKFAIVTSVADIKAPFAEGKISLAMGMENGAPIEGDLENLRHLYNRGIRYITLTHAKNNHISDSSYEQDRRWHGLSPFGEQVVAEMNRLGIMVDVSHVSDEAFYQVMEISKAPVIASHSSCRSFTPGWERNMSDEMIKLLASKGGVIHINFGSSFVNDEYRRKSESIQKHIDEYLKANHLKRNDPAAQAYIKKYQEENPTGNISDVVAHIDHVARLVGVDHVGFGSDFDGVGDSLPYGLKDVSDYPNLIYELLKKGYSDEDIEKICSGNLLRLWSEVERIARESK
ncbi:MAG: membrane dipeptidase [Acidobacteria bacterium]|nr:membrane dipeptidase [Acidobacteriota bacterium]